MIVVQEGTEGTEVLIVHAKMGSSVDKQNDLQESFHPAAGGQAGSEGKAPNP